MKDKVLNKRNSYKHFRVHVTLHDGDSCDFSMKNGRSEYCVFQSNILQGQQCDRNVLTGPGPETTAANTIASFCSHLHRRHANTMLANNPEAR